MKVKTGVAIDLTNIDAVIFDMDGVITETATIHAAAWKELFDEYLKERAGSTRGNVCSQRRRTVGCAATFEGTQGNLMNKGRVLK